MSQVATAWRLASVAVLAGIGFSDPILSAQPAQASPIPGLTSAASLGWRRLGGSALDLHLAGPATGSVAQVWYSSDGGTLFVTTPDGRSFQTADFDNWTATDAQRPSTGAAIAEKVPERGARLITATGDTRRVWALGGSLYVSSDSGATWTSLSGADSSAIGEQQRDVAVNPRDSSIIAVANDSGVWQTQDGGETWAGLNGSLPALPVARISSVTRGSLQVALSDGRVLQLANSRKPWQVVTVASALSVEATQRQKLTQTLGAEITAWAASGELAYAGSTEGRTWVSRDSGVTWLPSQSLGRGVVERFSVDTEAPRSALAVLSGSGPHVVRTVNGGAVWDDISGNLADVMVNAAVADRASGMAYCATDRGVYMARVDTNAFAAPSAWTLLPDSLPNSRAIDITLDPKAGQLFVAIQGYGVYTTASPVRNGILRLINSADFSSRPAAPGSLVSVAGGKVLSASSGSLQFPVLASYAIESQLQVPFESRAENVELAVRTSVGSASLPLSIRSVSPAIFVDSDGSPLLVDGESGLTLDSDAGVRPRTRLQLMATGLGRVEPVWPTGIPAPAENPPVVAATVQAYLDGVPLESVKATLAPGYVGYYLIEAQLPAILNTGSAELYLVVDGQESNKVRIQIESE